MLEKEYENIITSEITKEKTVTKPIIEMIEEFERKLTETDFLNNAVIVEEYFGIKSGTATARDKLLENQIVKKDWFLNATCNFLLDDFKGLYVFIHDGKPFYFGISKKVLRRIIQHVKGEDQSKATLAYNIGLKYYKLKNNSFYLGRRTDFDFKKYVDPIKMFLMKQKVAFFKIEDDNELYFFELYCALKYKTILNSFETH